ncbi:hypothetical protein DFJ74DRAFT_654276 [Hyaloraphidium curvatum]|nr:hypothetical protein DFJ74DRAFT_654276 [Hyaloraphidium curvatum]
MGTLETLQAELAAFHEQRAMLRTSIEVLRVLNGELSGNETTTGQEQAGDMQMPGIGLQEEAVALQISAETVQLSIAPMDEELAAAEQDATKETMQELPGPEDEALTPLTAVAEVEEKAAPAIEVSEAPSAQLVTDPEPAKVEEEPATPDTAGTSYEEDAGPEEEKQAPQQETERTGLELGDIVVVAMIPLMIFVSVLRRVLDYAEARV